MSADRESLRAWHALVQGMPLGSEEVAPLVLRSWRRCAERGLNWQAVPLMPEPFELTAAQAWLAGTARSCIEDLAQFVAGSPCVVLLTDTRLQMIEVLGQEPLAAGGVALGACWAEELVGSNALDLALREAQPVLTNGAEHYCQWMQGLSVAAAPLFDVAGQALGTLAVVGPAGSTSSHTLGMVSATAQALHNQLRTNQLLAEANDRLAALHATFEAMSEGLIFVGPGGEVSQINARACQMLGLNARAVAGSRLGEALTLPEPLRIALAGHNDLADVELLFSGRGLKLVALCSLRAVWESGRRYLGSLLTLKPAEAVQRLVQQVMGAQAQLTFADIIGESPALQLALRHARIAAAMSTNVLIVGEAGVGKKLFAHAVHNASSRAGGPFVALNCAGTPRGLLAAELFGVEGEVAAPHQGRPGRLELASGGTLLLEEIAVLPMDLQTELLRAIENQRTIRGGGLRVVPIDVRVMVTSSGDLDEALAAGRFRADLFHRLSGISITIPPLRDRSDDLLLLQDHLLRLLGQQLGKQVVLAPDALDALRCYHWPGNVRELETMLEQLLHTTEKNVLLLADLPRLRGSSPQNAAPRLQESHADAERQAIMRAGRDAGGHLGRTAELLKISRATLWRKMRLYGIERITLR